MKITGQKRIFELVLLLGITQGCIQPASRTPIAPYATAPAQQTQSPIVESSTPTPTPTPMFTPKVTPTPTRKATASPVATKRPTTQPTATPTLQPTPIVVITATETPDAVVTSTPAVVETARSCANEALVFDKVDDGVYLRSTAEIAESNKVTYIKNCSVVCVSGTDGMWTLLTVDSGAVNYVLTTRVLPKNDPKCAVVGK